MIWRSRGMKIAVMSDRANPLRGRSLFDILGLTIMLVRGWFYFAFRLKLPRLILMDRGARILGLGNIVFDGPTKIGLGAVLDARWCASVKIGSNVSIGDYAIIRCSGSPIFRCPGVSIGDRSSFGPFCNIGGGYGLEIGPDCLFGPYVSVHPEYHLTDAIDVPIRTQGVAGVGIHIGKDNWLGAKATILDGARLGDGNVIAAGAIVRKGDCGSQSIWAGVPARQIGSR